MNLKTGDIILCDDLSYGDWGLLSWFIKFMSKSDFSHIGMIVKDPDFIDPPLKGTYIWMSGTSNVPDSEDNTIKFGVQFVPYDEYVTTYGGKLYIRKLHCWKYDELFTTERLKKIHQVVYDKPYDLVITDWIEAYCKKIQTLRRRIDSSVAHLSVTFIHNLHFFLKIQTGVFYILATFLVKIHNCDYVMIQISHLKN